MAVFRGAIQLNEVTVSEPRYDPWRGGGGFSSDCDDDNYNGICDKDETTDCDDSNWNGICDKEESGGGGDSDKDNADDDRIIDNTKKPCVSDIIGKLQQKDRYKSLVPDFKGTVHLSQIILDLFGECKNYDLEIKVAELGSDANGKSINAHTSGIESITLDEDLVDDATQLSIAKTLIYESLHVYINYRLKTDRNSDLVTDLNRLYKAYKKKGIVDRAAFNLSQHEFMSQFVEAMAHSLSAYDGHKQDISYYTKLSWGGLEYSDTYKSLSSRERNKIQNVINNERYARKNAKSTKCD